MINLTVKKMSVLRGALNSVYYVEDHRLTSGNYL